MKKTNIALSALLKLTVIISALTGTWLSAFSGRNSFMGGRTVFMYFTIHSNIALALICLAGLILLLRHKEPGRAGQIIKHTGTVSITLTGIVFCFILAPTMKVNAWSTANILTHVVVPIAAVLDFFASGYRYSYSFRDDLWVIVPPLLYACYAAIGYVLGWEFGAGVTYPYFFLNWGSTAGAFGFSEDLPYMGCVWWILLLLLFLVAVGLLYLWILRRIRIRITRSVEP